MKVKVVWMVVLSGDRAPNILVLDGITYQNCNVILFSLPPVHSLSNVALKFSVYGVCDIYRKVLISAWSPVCGVVSETWFIVKVTVKLWGRHGGQVVCPGGRKSDTVSSLLYVCDVCITTRRQQRLWPSCHLSFGLFSSSFYCLSTCFLIHSWIICLLCGLFQDVNKSLPMFPTFSC